MSGMDKTMAFELWRNGFRPVEDEVCVFIGPDMEQWLHEGAVWREAIMIQAKAKAIFGEQAARARASLPREPRTKPRQRRAKPLKVEPVKKTWKERLFG